MTHGGKRPGAGRPKLPARERASKTIAVRLTRAELATLRAIDASPSVAVKSLIAERAKRDTPAESLADYVDATREAHRVWDEKGKK